MTASRAGHIRPRNVATRSASNLANRDIVVNTHGLLARDLARLGPFDDVLHSFMRQIAHRTTGVRRDMAPVNQPEHSVWPQLPHLLSQGMSRLVVATEQRLCRQFRLRVSVACQDGGG